MQSIWIELLSFVASLVVTGIIVGVITSLGERFELETVLLFTPIVIAVAVAVLYSTNITELLVNILTGVGFTVFILLPLMALSLAFLGAVAFVSYKIAEFILNLLLK